MEDDDDEFCEEHFDEFHKLNLKTWTRPYYSRVRRKTGLNDTQRDCVAYTINKSSDLAREGYYWKWYGDVLYTLQLLSSALVPVLIGIVGTFKIPIVDHTVRLLAILLSIVGTCSTAIEQVQNFRGRGQARVQYADKMNNLFQSYDACVGEFRDLDDETAFFIYIDGFFSLLRDARQASFLGMYGTSIKPDENALV